MFVTSVGPKSQWGIIKEHLSERDQEDTPLQEKLEEVAELIGKVGLGVAIACFVVLTISWIAAGNYKASLSTCCLTVRAPSLKRHT